MTASSERAHLISMNLHSSHKFVHDAIERLKVVKTYYNDPQEKGGLHFIDAEIGALELARRSISLQLTNWESFLQARESKR